MATLQADASQRAQSGKSDAGRLFILDVSDGRILAMKPDGSDRKVIVTGCQLPDGIVVDVDAGHIYWTSMGVPNQNDGSIERADVDGRNRQTVVPRGATFTPKQLHLDKGNGKLYWCDREGMRVMRCNFDGSHIETLVDSSKGEGRPGKDQMKWCVGITLDPELEEIYWTQKGPDDGGLGRILRASIEIPKGETAASRSDIEVVFDGLPEPIDLELDLEHRILYWTDRGDPPLGNTVNRAPIDRKAGQSGKPQIVLTHLMEGIGIALDVPGERMFLTDLGGSVYLAGLDGTNKQTLLYAQGNLTGVAFAEIPKQER